MGQTRNSTFKVDDIVQSQGDIWLIDQTMDIPVCVEYDDQYGDELLDRLNDVEEGDVIEATIESQNPQHTEWRFKNIS